MSRATLEQRVSVLEEQVRAMLEKSATAPTGLRRFSGVFTGDDLMKQIFEEGRRIRESERKRARRQDGKSRKARS